MALKYIVSKTTIAIEFNVITDSLIKKKKMFKSFLRAILEFCVA